MDILLWLRVRRHRVDVRWNFILFFLACVFTLSYPCYAAYSLCKMMRHCECALLLYKNKLEFLQSNFNSDRAFFVIKKYFSITYTLREIKNKLSLPLLTLTLSIVFNLFSVLTLYLSFESSLALYHFINFTLTITSSVTALIAISYFCEQVPIVMSQIRWVSGMMINELVNFNSLLENKKVLFLLKKLETTEIIYMSGGGIFIISVI